MVMLALVACGRVSTSSGPSVASVYAGRVVLNDLNPVVRDLPSWWDGPPTFDVKPLNSATRPDVERFAVSVRFSHVGTVEQTTEDDLDRVYRVNVKGVYNCLKLGVTAMKGRGGAILNVASVASTVFRDSS